MVDILETVERLTRGIEDRLTARTAYGEPIEAHGVTVVPVAKIAFGFGGGGGGGTGQMPSDGNGAVESREPSSQRSMGTGGGGGGGGGGYVRPIGFIEITEAGARYVPIEPPRAEFALRALTTLALLTPGKGRGGFFRRLLLLAAGQAIITAIMQPRLPPIPEGFSTQREREEAMA